MPREYNDRDLYLNSITAIYGYNPNSKNIEKLFRYEYLPFPESGETLASGEEYMEKRMNYVNTCDTDLNGGGIVTVSDVTEIQRVLAGFDNIYHIGEPVGDKQNIT